MDSPALPRTGRVAIGATVVAVGIAVLVTLAGGDVYALLGDTDPGLVTSLGVVLLRVVADAASGICLGGLVFATALAPAASARKLGASGYGGVRVAAGGAVVWALASALLVPWSAADAAGQPVSMVLRPDVLPAMISAVEEPKAWLCSLAAAGLVAALTWWTLSWRVAAAAVPVAAAGVLAPMVSGHAAVGAWHDIVTNVMVWHVLAAAVWLGGLATLLVCGRRSTRDKEVLLRRYRWLATGCLVLLSASGLVAAWSGVRAGGLTSGYGVLLGAKVLGSVVLVVLAHQFRRRQRSASVVRLLGVELVVLAAAVGVSVGLTHLVPPAFLADPASATEILLGYDLPSPPDFAAFFLGWRPDVLLGTVTVALLIGYLVAVRRLRARGDEWARGRVVAWVLGCLLLLVTTSSGVGRFSPALFSVHMVAHMSLTMMVPVLLVLGGPVTLALRVLRPGGDTPGPREWLVWVLHSPATRVLAHPLVAASLFVGSFYLLYFTDLFEQAMLYHWAHQVMNIHFLVTGYLFFWQVIGVDRAPRPLPHLGRLAMLFAVMPFHAFFGVIVMNSQGVIAETFYRYLSLPWHSTIPDLLADQRLGGGIAWATGEIPMIVVVIALVSQWAKADDREARRTDRKAEQDGDAELAAYNAMLERLAARDR